METFLDQLNRVDAWVLWVLFIGLYFSDSTKWFFGLVGFIAIAVMV